MACDPTEIVCELERLRQSVDGWNWGAFASTLIATLVGAVIGIGGVLLVASRERRERYEAGLDTSCARLIQALADFRDAAHAYSVFSLSGRLRAVPPPPPASSPSRVQVEAALRIVAMLARGRDGHTFNAIELVVSVVLDKPEDGLDAGVLSALNLLGDWRSGGFQRDVIESEAAKALAEFGHG